MARFPALSIAVAISAWSICIVPLHADNAYSLADSGAKAIHDGDLGVATADLERALAIGRGVFKPAEYAQVAFNLAFAHHHSGRIESARKLYVAAARNAPLEYNSAWTSAARCARVLGDLRGAEKYIKRAIAGGAAENPRVLLQYGGILNDLQRFREAAAVYQQGLSALEREVRNATGLKTEPSSRVTQLEVLLDSSPAVRELGSALFAHLGDSLDNEDPGGGAVLAAVSAALALEPKSTSRLSALWFAFEKECSWEWAGSLRRRLLHALDAGIQPESSAWETGDRVSTCADAASGHARKGPARFAPSPASPYRVLSLDMSASLRKRIGRSLAAKWTADAGLASAQPLTKPQPSELQGMPQRDGGKGRLCAVAIFCAHDVTH
jgi:tetratricopeptide (TPR) repeat protein